MTMFLAPPVAGATAGALVGLGAAAGAAVGGVDGAGWQAAPTRRAATPTTRISRCNASPSLSAAGVPCLPTPRSVSTRYRSGMSTPIWDAFLTERDKRVFGGSGYGRRAGWGQRPVLLIIDVNCNVLDGS